MKDNPIIIIDDEIEITSSYEIFLRKFGHKDYKVFNSPTLFVDQIESLDPAVIFMDLRMPGISGDDLLSLAVKAHPDASVFIISGTDEVETAIRCIKNGALDYIVKPIDKDRFQTALIKGLEVFNIKRELKEIKQSLMNSGSASPKFNKIITRNKDMLNNFKYIEAVAPSPATVLITGETGTGKDLLAEAVHKCSGRKGSYIPVNVSALDENMFNDTLFGHIKGAFTGADQVRKGLLSNAENGTIFLDEIGDLKESSQIKLLRLIQNNEYFPIGSDKPVKTNARIIAATNADLEKKVTNKEFRQDLYYRLKTHMINVMPLRSRCGDISLLTHHFFARELEERGFEQIEVPVELIDAFLQYDFPGNVRELLSVIVDYVMLFGDAEIKKSDLKNFLKKHGISLPKSGEVKGACSFSYEGKFPTLKEMENKLIDFALKSTNGNQSKAAQMLGITRQALNKRLSG